MAVREVNHYLSSKSDRLCAATDYADSNGVNKGTNGNCVWWLRTMGRKTSSAVQVRDDGYVYYIGNIVNSAVVAVRPALWISIES